MVIVSRRGEIVPHASQRHHEGIPISHRSVQIERKKSSYDQDTVRREGAIRILIECWQRGSGGGSNQREITGQESSGSWDPDVKCWKERSPDAEDKDRTSGQKMQNQDATSDRLCVLICN